MTDPLQINSIEYLYKALKEQGEVNTKAHLMLMLRSWITEVSNFDPVYGHALRTDMIDFIDMVFESMQHESLEKDRIYRIVSHTKEAILAIMKHTRDKILREHAMLPIHAAREVDSNSVKWLSRQPGRTLREKLSGKPYMKAVRRRHSVDTSENRLLKAFLYRLEQILIERQNVLSAVTEEICEELLLSIQRWLKTEDAAEIGAWGNLPPNNTLLQDKRYRKVWDGWLWLQAIDEQITGDSKRIYQDILNVIYWNTLSLLNNSGHFRTVQQPVAIDYDNFVISPRLPVRGYLLRDKSTTKFLGTIEKLVTERGFGFIDGYFFHASDLESGLHFNELQLGDRLLFDVEETPRGKIAKRLEAIPRWIEFELSNGEIDISIEGETISVTIYDGQVVLMQKNKSKKNKFRIDPTALKEIPKIILSLVTDAPFKYSELTKSQNRPIQMDSCVVDLCSIRPAFTNNTGSQEYLPFRLLQQTWTLKDGTKHVTDCSNTKAIMLSNDIETVSMRSLFSNSSALPDATKSSASKFFAKKLSDYIKTEKLTYLVPDWGNDFDLERIRKSVNFYFDESSPLPKSIAAIFAWQGSNQFKNVHLNNESEILVIDSFYGGFSITPITIRFYKKLKQKSPKTMGITWERHPTFVIKNDFILKEIVQKLKSMECPFPEEVIQLFGLDGLMQEAGKLTLEKDSEPFHVTNNIKNISNTKGNVYSSVYNKELKSYLDKKEVKNTFVLPLSQSIIIDPLLKKFKRLSVKGEILLTEGALTLSRWQERVDDIALWRDHLPELSIRIVRDGHFENFYLVKDATVTPQRGRTVNIPVKESFTLPAGKTYYSFPLQQGKGNKELRFVAYLKSPAFPLKKATECKLKMTYTYGADDPYELKLIPLNTVEAGFKSIRVEWRSISKEATPDLESLPVPDFPARKSWSDFQKFPKEDGKSFSDLLDWGEGEMKKICDIEEYGRVSGAIPEWIDKGDDNIFCFIDDVLIHKSSLLLKKGQELPLKGEMLSFYKIKNNRGRFSAKDVTLRTDQPMSCFLSKSLRFPALTIWNHGHSLSESDVPDHFRNAIFEGIQKSLSIIESEDMPHSLKEELFFFLCCLHKDAPEIVGTRLLDYVKDKELLWKYNRNIAFAIGNAELGWQEELFNNILNKINSESIVLDILAIALWRSEKLIFKLSKENFNKCNQKLVQNLNLDLQRLSSNISQDRISKLIDKGLDERKAFEKERAYQVSTLCKHLELLLALLRSRGSEDENIRTILAPNNDLTKKYVELVDKISKIVIERNIKLNSRISLQIDKPRMFRNTPDLLYALRMYLTGDSGSNTIVITGVNDQD